MQGIFHPTKLVTFPDNHPVNSRNSLYLVPLANFVAPKKTMALLDMLASYETWRDTPWRRTEVSQLEEFTEREVFVQRVLAVLSSSTSIVFCLAALYMYFAMDPRRIVFRHHLILFLLCYDLLKAIILLIYPLRLLSESQLYFDQKFCHTVGFFTATAVEGADFAILSFALHTFLLIFKTDYTVRLPSGRTEGGLYIARHYVYILSVVVPLVLASLAFIGEGYNPYVCWCYLPQRPVWYRLVLSWVPRFTIVVLIFTFYIMIYFHVIREFKALGGMFVTMNQRRNQPTGETPTFFSALKYAYSLFIDSVFPRYDMDSVDLSQSQDFKNKLEVTQSPNAAARESPKEEQDFTIVNPNLYGENLANFRKRQKVIQKQMKLIFVYPIAYLLVWTFPFVLFCTQVNYEEKHHPVYWLNCMGAFMQPLNGFVDLLVFFYRELPWEATIMQSFTKENAEKYVSMVTGQDQESMATSTRLARQLVSASMAHQVSDYLKWRQVFHYIKLPFYKLPTQENVSKALDKMQQQLQNHHFMSSGNNATTGGLHDFLNILSGDLLEKEFRAMELFSMGQRTQLVYLGNSSNKRASILNRLWRSRQQSVVDPILEGRIMKKLDSINGGTQLSVPGGAVLNGSGISTYNNSQNSRHKSVSNKSFTAKKMSVGLSSLLNLYLLADSDEMDFMEFLKKGPTEF